MTWLVPAIAGVIAWVLFMRELGPDRTNVHRRLVVRFDVDLTPFLRAIEQAQRSFVTLIGSPQFRALAKVAELEKRRADEQLAGIRVILDRAVPDDRVYLVDEEAIRRPPTDHPLE